MKVLETDHIDIDVASENLQHEAIKLTSKLMWGYKIRMYFIIYRLLSKGLVSISDMAWAMKASRATVYRIVQETEKFIEEKKYE